jgi:hypothetical protein
MVELAIILPVVLLLMFGITEFGSAILRYNTLTKAVQDGARHAAAYGLLGTAGSVYIDPALDSEIRNLVVYGDSQGVGTPLLRGMTLNQIDISVPAPGFIRVVATYPYVPGFGTNLPTFGLGGSPSLAVDLTASVTMRAL